MIAWHENKFAPKPGTILCKPTEIENGAAREFRFGGDSPFAFRMFVYNDAGNFRGFHNSCPHFDVPMNHTPEELFTPDGEYFQCVTHYAKFDKSSGICVYGPCEGKSLQRIPLTMEANNLKIGTAWIPVTQIENCSLFISSIAHTSIANDLYVCGRSSRQQIFLVQRYRDWISVHESTFVDFTYRAR